MLDISEITLRVAGRALLEGASARVSEGHRIGLIGRNGTGKTTLLKLLMRQMEADQGKISLPRDCRIGTVAQEVAGDGTTPLDLVMAGDTERAALIAESLTVTDPERIADIQMRLVDIGAYAAEARAATILHGLGFDANAQNMPLSAFSGGWRMRAALAAALFAEPDLLLLDEPTNHLDIEAALWLEGFLQRWPRTLIMISHDRDFLNAVCTGIIHLQGQKLTVYSGNYDTFERVRAEKIALTESSIAKQQAQRAHMQAFVDRFKAKASKARQAQSRMKAIAKLAPIASIERDPDIKFGFPNPDELSPPMVTLDETTVGYDGRAILRGVDFRLDPDDRVALLGSNGNGKTTLAKLIAGRLDTMEGERKAAAKLRVGYFAQHQVDELRLGETPIDAMSRALPGVKPETVRARLGAFGFGAQKANTQIGKLSGGEKARLTLALITIDAPHLLILDEPTNHLDIEARQALVEALSDYTGAVILVSHDRGMVEMVADRLMLVEDGTVRDFDGDVEDYRKHILSKSAEASADKRAAARADKQEKKNDAERRKQAAALREQLKPLRNQTDKAEKKLAELNGKKAKLEAEMAAPAIANDRIAAISKEIGALGPQIASAEEAWLALADQLENAQAVAAE